MAHKNYLFTSESVSEGHPDKVCDQISDAILDAFLENDVKLGISDDSLVNTDLVLWLTVGHHHVTATEDFPVLSLEPLSFKLKPVNFFDRNPALDLRRAPFEAP